MWIHEDPKTKEDKLRLVRTMDSNDAKDEEMLAIALSYVRKALVSYAHGNPSVKTVKSYGLLESCEIDKQRCSKNFPQLHWR